MPAIRFYIILLFSFQSFHLLKAQEYPANIEEAKALMYRVNDYYLSGEWKNNDRNWKRGTYFIGLMAFYEASGDSVLFHQALTWAQKHGWRTGTEWTFPPNRLTCSQTYLQIYFKKPNPFYIERTQSFMDKRVENREPAGEQGWDYVDALFVGTPAWIMMSEATGNRVYSDYGCRMFFEVQHDLYNTKHHLFYRDEKAKTSQKSNYDPEFWARGNGWAMAAIPRILQYLAEDHSQRGSFIDLFTEMASIIKDLQQEDGFWRSDLLHPTKYPNPESSSTALFTYALAWGINNDLLNEESYSQVVEKAWRALAGIVDQNGKVCYGQTESRDPGPVDKSDSDEFVSGVFLLAGSEMINLYRSRAEK
ncbi:MAG: glycoside hydrolase family 88 protein [Bacteroidales bacterium]|nr:glycoside hydrolase family 88 protein [Bacteroidales bacterium]